MATLSEKAQVALTLEWQLLRHCRDQRTGHC